MAGTGKYLWIMVLLQAAISASSLVVEIVAGRMIAPYVGMSLYTWTAIIAVVLAGFSVGHWWGGRIAAHDSQNALRQTAWTMVAAALTTAAASLMLRGFSGPLIEAFNHPLAAITALSMVAFFLPSLFAGIPAPVLTVVAMRGHSQSERVLGVMFATGAIGAIFGTLLAGFFFVPRLGSMTTLMVIAVIYALAAVVCFALARVRGRDLGLGFAACLALVGLGYQTLNLPAICDEESEYFCIRTVTLSDAEGARVHLMVLDHLAHGISGEAEPRQMQTDHAAMLDALPRMRMGEKDFSSFHIGGGAFSVPRGWAAHGLGQITVAEIDPAVTQVAIDDFWLPAGQVTVLHEDARMALRNTPTRYDVIIGDAFTDIAVPEHLITQEFFELVASRLTDGGVFAMNLIDNVDRMDALAAMIVTLQAVFPSVEVWTEARGPSMGERRVFVLLCGETPSPVSRLTAGSPDPMIFQPLDDAFVAQIVADKQPRVLTDDYAPISALIGFEPILN